MRSDTRLARASELLKTPFNRTLLSWLSAQPRSFTDIVAASGVSQRYATAQLQHLLKAELIEALRANRLNQVGRFWVNPTLYRAALVQQNKGSGKTASRARTGGAARRKNG
jgi:DNA-binding transcriptional ArsR family regulator